MLNILKKLSNFKNLKYLIIIQILSIKKWYQLAL